MQIQKPAQPVKSDKPVKYHCYDSCNKCSGNNELISPSMDERGIYETKTKCKDCGFEDYWGYGFFESGQEMESKCKTYSFI